MKRITPRQDYEGGAGYPAADEARLTRRGFLGRAAAAAAAAMAGGVVGASRTEAAPAARPGVPGQAEPARIRIDLPYQNHVTGTDLRPERVEIFVRDKDIIRFLEKTQERAGLQQAVTKVTAGAKAEDFYEGQRLFQLEQRIARSVEAQIRKRTKRAVPTLDLMLHAGQGYRIRTAGVMVRPLRPVLAPHRSP